MHIHGHHPLLRGIDQLERLVPERAAPDVPVMRPLPEVRASAGTEAVRLFDPAGAFADGPGFRVSGAWVAEVEEDVAGEALEFACGDDGAGRGGGVDVDDGGVEEGGFDVDPEDGLGVVVDFEVFGCEGVVVDEVVGLDGRICCGLLCLVHRRCLVFCYMDALWRLPSLRWYLSTTQT